MSQIPDEKLQAVVSLVVQAVDQRLNTVREQLVQLAKSVARNQSELQKQIDQCRMMCEMATSAPVQGSSDFESSAAAQQLLLVATTLAEQVGSFEARVNQYTNERIAELPRRIDAAADDGGQHHSLRHSGPVPVVQFNHESLVQSNPIGADDISPAAARLAPLGAAPRTNVPAAAGPPAAASVAPARLASAQVAPVDPVAPVATSTGDPDLDALTRQMSERLSAAIEKALGVSS